MRRSHSLDSGLNSVTGLLDQLAMGQLASDDDSLDCGVEAANRDCESWMLVDALSEDSSGAAPVANHGEPIAACTGTLTHQQEQQLHSVLQQGAGQGAAVKAAATLLSMGGGANAAQRLHQQLLLQQQQPAESGAFAAPHHLPPVQETPEDL
jgi:hypothetical protein